MKRTYDLKKVFVVLILSCLTAICFALTINPSTIHAQTGVTISMKAGASVRVKGIDDGKYGIMWQLTAENYTESETDLYGILIAPTDYGTIDEETVFGENAAFWWVDKDGVKHGNTETGKQIWNLTTDKLTYSEKEDIYYFNGSLVDIDSSLITREFIGVGYMIQGGQYTFADTNENERTMHYVALRYLESDKCTLDATQRKEFKDAYVNTQDVSVTFDLAGEQQQQTLALAVGETYTAAKLAKEASIDLTGMIKSSDVNVTVDDATTEITGVAFESVTKTDLAGTYSVSGKDVKLELDGTASIGTTYGNWELKFDDKLYSTVAMVAIDEDNSFVVEINKSGNDALPYELTDGNNTYAQTEVGLKSIYDLMLGAYDIQHGYNNTNTGAYRVSIELDGSDYTIRNNNYSVGKGPALIRKGSHALGTYLSSKASVASTVQGYYTRVENKWYLFNRVTDNGQNHYQLHLKNRVGSRTEEPLEVTIYNSIAGNYIYSDHTYITLTNEFVVSTDDTNNDTKSIRAGNAKKSSGVLNGVAIGETADLLFVSENVGYVRFADKSNSANPSPNNHFAYFIAGDMVVLAENGIVPVINDNSLPNIEQSGLVLVKGDSGSTEAGYISAVKTYVAGTYVCTNGDVLVINADGTATFNGDTVEYSVIPERSFTNGAGSIYKGVIQIAGRTVNYDFSTGRTHLSGDITAMQLG